MEATNLPRGARPVQRRLRMYLDTAAAAAGSKGLERIEQMLRLALHLDEPEYDHALHRPTQLYLPGLRCRPLYDAEEFPWSRDAKAAEEAIRLEFLALTRRGVVQPYLQPFDRRRHARARSRPAGVKSGATRGKYPRADWNSYFLYRHGEWVTANSRFCPDTVRFLSTTPLGMGEAIFSVLEPGAWIAPHSGGSNVVLTCHLPLIVPEGCGIRIATETHVWQEGELLVFDDSFLHFAWNNGGGRRVVLLWDIWHPDLTEVEACALKVLFQIIVNGEPVGTSSLIARHRT
jgi:aspartyl/asparaginyl beta-hydroxylase (cupin superfamily)